MKNRNKAILVASLISAANSYAACSVPSNGATAGSTVTCTGTTTGVYSINAANVTFLNQGRHNWYRNSIWNYNISTNNDIGYKCY
jgi:hypothetical protein